jgi:hypothetical protein
MPIAALNAKCLLNQAVSQFEGRQEIALLGAVVMKDVTKFHARFLSQVFWARFVVRLSGSAGVVACFLFACSLFSTTL